MNAHRIARIARIALFCVAGVAAATGVQAKGSLGVGLTIVSSCAASSANAYRAAAANAAVLAGSATAVVAGCTGNTGYTVSVSPAKAESSTVAQADRQVQTSPAGADTSGDVVVTLTY